jgi:hypothetical protein
MLALSVQYTNLAYRDRNGIRAYDAGLKFSPYDADDELMFAFAEPVGAGRYACLGAASASPLLRPRRGRARSQPWGSSGACYPHWNGACWAFRSQHRVKIREIMVSEQRRSPLKPGGQVAPNPEENCAACPGGLSSYSFETRQQRTGRE